MCFHSCKSEEWCKGLNYCVLVNWLLLVSLPRSLRLPDQSQHGVDHSLEIWLDDPSGPLSTSNSEHSLIQSLKWSNTITFCVEKANTSTSYCTGTTSSLQRIESDKSPCRTKSLLLLQKQMNCSLKNLRGRRNEAGSPCTAPAPSNILAHPPQHWHSELGTGWVRVVWIFIWQKYFHIHIPCPKYSNFTPITRTGL